MAVDAKQIRRDWKIGDDVRDAGLTTPDSVIRYDDIQYGRSKKWQKLDVYRPKEEKGKLPVIISIHGGAWVYGDKERYQYYCLNLAEEGFAVVNFTYRLAPEYKFPAPLEDANTVIKWIYKHADEYGFDTDHIFGVGDSAGAHLLGLFACYVSNPEYQKNFKFKPHPGFRLSGVCLNCGIYDLKSSPNGFVHECMEVFLKDGGTDEEYDSINVLANMTEDFPPSYIMTAVGDFLREEAPGIKKRLDELGVESILKEYGDENTFLGHVFHCDFRLPEARICNHEECDFMRTLCIMLL